MKKKVPIVGKKRTQIQICVPINSHAEPASGTVSKWCNSPEKAADHWATIRALPLYQQYRHTPYNKKKFIYGNDIWRHFRAKLIRRTLPIFQKVFV